VNLTPEQIDRIKAIRDRMPADGGLEKWALQIAVAAIEDFAARELKPARQALADAAENPNMPTAWWNAHRDAIQKAVEEEGE